MAEIARETVCIAAPPEAVWALLEDPVAMARVFPDSESVVAEAADRFRIVAATRVMFVTLRLDVLATLHDHEPPRHVLLRLDGTPRGYGVRFEAAIPIDIAPSPGGSSSVTYSVDLAVHGTLPAFASKAIDDAVRHQAAQTVRNLERELAPR